MQTLIKRKRKAAGFTLVEALTLLFIFSLVSLTFYSVFSLGTRYNQDAKNRLGAVAVANEKMEIVRNLKYDKIGTTTGIPSGVLLEDENVTENTRTFHVKTFVQYIDDSFDGTSPTDTVPNDYKRVKITVSWSNQDGTGETALISRFVPAGLETASGDGTLSINVINTDGGVPQATVHIVNTDISPQVNITAKTDDTGNLFLPGAKQSIQKYQITVSKSGYETVTTVDPGAVSYVPTDSNASVIKGELNMKDIVLNKIANLKVSSVDNLDSPVVGLNFHIQGGRIIGSDTLVAPPVSIYGLNENGTTDSNGEKIYAEISPGQHFLSAVEVPSGYSLIGLDPISSIDQATGIWTFSLLPEEIKTLKVRMAESNKDGLLIRIKKEDGSLIAGAQVKVTNGSGYDVTQNTLSDGTTFFPNSSDPFLPGDYNIEVKMTGFTDVNDSANVDKFTTKEIQMIAN